MWPWSLNWSREKDLSQYLRVYSSARARIDSIAVTAAPRRPPERSLQGSSRAFEIRTKPEEIDLGSRILDDADDDEEEEEEEEEGKAGGDA